MALNSYEELLVRIQDLPRPKAESERRVLWLGEAALLGVTRAPGDRLEVFIRGPLLEAKRVGLKRALEHGEWYREGAEGVAFTANRIRLPAASYAG